MPDSSAVTRVPIARNPVPASSVREDRPALAIGLVRADDRFLRVARDRDVVRRRDEVRAAVERIDLLRVVEADPAQHLLDALGLLADLADDRADVLGQELGVDRIVGEQRVDELLVVLRQPIRFLIREPREVAAERLPQLRRAIGLERRQQLGQHLIAEQLAMHAHEQEPHVRQRLAERIRVAPVLRQQDEAADLGRAVVVVADAQRLMDEVAIERDRVALVALDPEEDVRRALGAVLRVDHRRADDPLLREVLEHEQELALDHRRARP